MGKIPANKQPEQSTPQPCHPGCTECPGAVKQRPTCREYCKATLLPGRATAYGLPACVAVCKAQRAFSEYVSKLGGGGL
ncbi:MAG: hypothetical protein S4CHLAM37_04750 [Chlamydiia bacterium]|nr:hypothetical protein [Chlamydiia bacterium]